MIAYIKLLYRRWRRRRNCTFEDSRDLLDLPIEIRLAALDIDETTRSTQPWRVR